MNELSREMLVKRSKFLSAIRRFFEERNYLETDTPFLKAVPSMEPYLDPFLVHSPSKKEKGYLITSPEYSLKEILSKGLERIYEIAHTFRSGEEGSPYHSAEFLMLEFYTVGMKLDGLMDFCTELLEFLDREFHPFGFDPKNVRRISVENALKEFAGCGISKEELDRTISLNKLSEIPDGKKSLRRFVFYCILKLSGGASSERFYFFIRLSAGTRGSFQNRIRFRETFRVVLRKSGIGKRVSGIDRSDRTDLPLSF